jgi:hypothetical protein
MSELTHLCLVSTQATPNLTPALDPATRPSRVILLVSPDMRRRAGWLERVLGSRGVKVERWAIEDPWNVEGMQFRVLELLEHEGKAVATRTLALNATGGTKPMSIAAYEAFRAYDLPIFYVHPESDRLIWMYPGDRPPVDLANRVRLDPFLLAHGARLEAAKTEGIPTRLCELTDWLVSRSGVDGRALGVLNLLAAQAEKGLVSPEMESRHLRNQRLQILIDRFEEAGLLQVQGRRLRFPDEEARFYVNGGWLEEHAFDVLSRLRGEIKAIQDLARSVTLVRETPRGDEVPNEIDVACLAENRLYLLECKTRSWRGADNSAAGADALYRLDTLGDLLGGLQARAMLVSYRDLPPPVLRRASDLGVRVCAGARLPELAAELRDWLG